MTNILTENFPDLEACYGQLMGWCDLLEAIADFLPCHVEDRLCETIIHGLVPLLSTTHLLEARVVSSHLGLIMIDDELTEAVERRRTSRLFDADAAQEVVDAICALKAGRCHLSWDAIGYLLRSFFCSMRRHIKAEREIVRQILKALERQDAQPVSVAVIEAA